MALILALGASGCQGGDIIPGVGDSTFVRTMADLRRVQADSTLGDSVRADARRTALRRHGVSAEQLERAARALADDPSRAQALFQAVTRATDSAAARAPEGEPQARGRAKADGARSRPRN